MKPAHGRTPPSDTSLDPEDWDALRSQGHRMLDDMLDYLQHLRTRPVWQPIPPGVRERFHEPLPQDPEELADLHQRFMTEILPYAVGNAHPGFMGWVHGGGTAVGMLAEMLAAGLNANLGGRDQVPVAVERQITNWMRDLFGFPERSSGLFVTGTSMANFIAVLVARTAVLGPAVRENGVAAATRPLTAYASAGAHGCIAQALDISGLGSGALRRIAVNERFQIDLQQLEQAILADREAGFQPFMVVGTAGTVDVGALDDLGGLAALCRRQGLWFHVDGAFGALARMSPELAPLVAGIELADSIAFDFHKWVQVPYDAGFILVRDETLHRQTFASPAAYLQRETRGVAAGSPWPCDYGPDLSRGFRALKTWFTLKTYGTARLGAVIAQTCALARDLEMRIRKHPELELLAPVALNIVCFRYRSAHPDETNARLVVALQESGVAVPSTTRIRGALAIRVAIVNHRTRLEDLDRLLKAVLAFGAKEAHQ
ncbi:MAG: aminotransferase class V-fold PLP-dependent enzyme [Betaproteobacteria bacterium]|nr:aminotransferase class V-fold PLP-dependent enzyme [Betaproteobacteria bacterium]MDE2131207.1 aminotransferase class V-fold PLP-dependent enzyme [Betaproteobacteria bacterium]MDE2211205.1 aminotransferase class V-fold PLP-dependent enzyme [Betaproteobacteria bacterium]